MQTQTRAAARTRKNGDVVVCVLNALLSMWKFISRACHGTVRFFVVVVVVVILARTLLVHMVVNGFAFCTRNEQF